MAVMQGRRGRAGRQSPRQRRLRCPLVSSGTPPAPNFWTRGTTSQTSGDTRTKKSVRPLCLSPALPHLKRTRWVMPLQATYTLRLEVQRRGAWSAVAHRRVRARARPPPWPCAPHTNITTTHICTDIYRQRHAKGQDKRRGTSREEGSGAWRAYGGSKCSMHRHLCSCRSQRCATVSSSWITAATTGMRTDVACQLPSGAVNCRCCDGQRSSVDNQRTAPSREDCPLQQYGGSDRSALAALA